MRVPVWRIWISSATDRSACGLGKVARNAVDAFVAFKQVLALFGERKKKDETRLVCSPCELCAICSGFSWMFKCAAKWIVGIYIYNFSLLKPFPVGGRAHFSLSLATEAPLHVSQSSAMKRRLDGGEERKKKHLKLQRWGFLFFKFLEKKDEPFVENRDIFPEFFLQRFSWHRALFGKNGWSYVKTVGCCGGEKKKKNMSACWRVLMYLRWDVKCISIFGTTLMFAFLKKKK